MLKTEKQKIRNKTKTLKFILLAFFCQVIKFHIFLLIKLSRIFEKGRGKSLTVRIKDEYQYC